MMSIDDLVRPLARARTDEVVVTTMSAVRPWARHSDSDLDFASADSAMGHAADLALGIAVARPQRQVICLNGDGSMLMSLGTLAAAVDAEADNFLLVVVVNGGYEITGNQPLPAARHLDYAAMARAAGFPRAHRFVHGQTWADSIPELLRAPGPVLVAAEVRPGSEPPISRGEHEKARYLQFSLYDWGRTLRAALRDPATAPRDPAP